MSKTVVVVGAGIGGLATANMLQKAGYDVHVYEKNSHLGGRAGVLRKRGFTYDTGPSWYLMPGVFRQYFSLFDIDVDRSLQLKKLTPAYKVFFESRAPITISGDLETDSATFDAIESGAGRQLRRYVQQGDLIYQLALRHFLYTNFDNPARLAHHDIVRHGVRLGAQLISPLHTKVRRFVHAKPLQQILEYPMVFLGTSPFRAPAMYSLMSALDFKEGVFYPKKGMYSIIELLVKLGTSLGVRYHTASPVKQILYEGSQATGILLESGRTVAADIVVSNADLHHTETALLPPEKRSYPARYWDKKQSGISALLMYVGVKGSLPQLEHHNLFFVDAWRENFEAIYTRKVVPKRASLYVSKTSKHDPSTAPAGHENIFVLVPLPTNISMTHTQLNKLADQQLEAFGKAADVPDLSKRVVFRELFGPDDFSKTYNAWQGTALGPSHILRQSAFWRIKNKSKKLRNLYYVGGATLPGIGLPMCLISAELVYKRITGDTSSGPVRTIEEDDS